MDNNKRIVVNTLAQHIRAILNMGMSLFATRYILLALGSTDFGIFSLIGSTVAMLGFITNALVVTTQRHLSFCYGTHNTSETYRIFANSLFIHLVIGIALTTILVIIEPILFSGFLEIDETRIPTAKKVYFIVIIMLFCSVMTSPFRAIFIARENIVYISIIDCLDGVIRLTLSIILLYVTNDRLVTYAWMMFSITIFNLLAFALYAKYKFPETCLWPKRSDINKSVIYKITDFAGWTIYSTGCIIGRTQGMAIVLNTFFGTVINTAYGIASQICNAVQFISQAIINAMSPQIIKSEGQSDRRHMLKLAEQSCKYSFLLLAILVIPICFEMPSLLSIWLGNIPEKTIEISQFILYAALIDQTTIGLGIANQAIGNIRNYSLTVNTIKIMTLPIVYLSLTLGFSLTFAMWWYVGIEGICAITRLPFLKYTAGLSIRHYANNVLAKIFLPTLALIFTGYLCTSIITVQYRFILTFLLSALVGITCIWTTSLSVEEKTTSLQMIKKNKQ